MKEINGFVFSDDLTVISEYKGQQKNIIIPKGVKRIDDYVFMDKDITSVVFNEELEIIGNRAFQGTNIKEIILPKSVDSVGFCAFNCCYKLKKVTIKNPVISMYTDSFDHCYDLEDIYFDGDEDEWLKTVYYDDDDIALLLDVHATIHLKDGSVIKYK